MNWLDLGFITLVIACGVVGVWLGLIRAALAALGAVLGILVAGQVSDDLGGLYASYISNETLANVIAYGLVILASIIVARVITIVVLKVVNLLAMGWVDKLAGLAMGLVAGAAITWAAIGGLAQVTYNSDLIEKGVAAGGLQDKANVTQVKDSLEGALIGSALVRVVVQVTDILPANALGFVPSSFMVALETLELRMAVSGPDLQSTSNP